MENSKTNFIHLKLSNYYGEVEAFKEDGKFYIGLDDYMKPSICEISEEFYNAIVKEFKGK